MDEIQKVLIKEGRKDLAQKYYEKIAQKQPDAKEIRNIIRELKAQKKQLENLGNLVKKYEKTNFDNVDINNFFDSSTNGQIRDLTEKLYDADYGLTKMKRQK